MKKMLAVAGVAMVVAMPLLAAAQTTIVNPTPVSGDPIQQLFRIIKTINNYFLTGLIVLAAVFVVYAGWKYLTAAGDEESVKTAKNVLIYAVVSIAVGLAAQIIVAVAQALVK